jgi:tyrosyl-tRNA synthetase
MFGSQDKVLLLQSMSSEQLDAIAQEIWSHTLNPDEMTEWSHSIIDLLVDSWLAPSRGEAKKLVQSWAVYLNETQIWAIDYVPSVDQRINNSFLLLRKGKKEFRIIKK